MPMMNTTKSGRRTACWVWKNPLIHICCAIFFSSISKTFHSCLPEMIITKKSDRPVRNNGRTDVPGGKFPRPILALVLAPVRRKNLARPNASAPLVQTGSLSASTSDTARSPRRRSTARFRTATRARLHGPRLCRRSDRNATLPHDLGLAAAQHRPRVWEATGLSERNSTSETMRGSIVSPLPASAGRRRS